MADVKWIKIALNIFDNRKIRQIEKMPEGDALIVIWLKLLCLAGETNDSGLIYLTREVPYTVDMLASQFDRPINTVKMALAIFERFGMIEIIDDIILLPSWEKYQSVEGMEKIREQNRIRKQRQRERQKMLMNPGVLALPAGEDEDGRRVTCHVTDTQGHAIDIDKERDKDIDKDKEIEEEREGEGNGSGVKTPETPPARKKSSRFVPPSLEEVKAYCAERGNLVDAERFFNYYTAANWYRGNTKIKDWRACVRTWEQKENKAPRYSAKAQEERGRVKTEAEHAQGGHASGFGW